jgi:CheY-like chemotaxis protein
MVREGLVGLLRSGLNASSKLAVRRLRIGTRQTGSTLQLVCQDTGPVISEAESRNIFELAHARDIESLGTSVIACVARAHGGKVSLRSQQGVGNAFLVELPMVDSVPSPNSQISFQDKRVLVVDDEEFLLECLTDAISSWGCATTACAMGAEAIEKLQQGTFDLIISDIRMPGLSGIQLYQWIQANQPAMTRQILFTTGDSFDPETRGFLESEKVPHLGKPFDLKKLKQALNDLFLSSRA